MLASPLGGVSLLRRGEPSLVHDISPSWPRTPYPHTASPPSPSVSLHFLCVLSGLSVAAVSACLFVPRTSAPTRSSRARESSESIFMFVDKAVVAPTHFHPGNFYPFVGYTPLRHRLVRPLLGDLLELHRCVQRLSLLSAALPEPSPASFQPEPCGMIFWISFVALVSGAPKPVGSSSRIASSLCITPARSWSVSSIVSVGGFRAVDVQHQQHDVDVQWCQCRPLRTGHLQVQFSRRLPECNFQCLPGIAMVLHIRVQLLFFSETASV